MKRPAAYRDDARDLAICAALDAGMAIVGVCERRKDMAARFGVSKTHIDRLAQELGKRGVAA